MAKRRDFNVFSLSFLDIMSCGFGAVILIFIVINHSTEATTREINVELLAEVDRIEELVKDETENLITLRNTVEEKEDEIVSAEQMAERLLEAIRAVETELSLLAQEGASQDEQIAALKSELKELEEEAANLEESAAADDELGRDLRNIAGEGDRQYLTGMNMGGEKILILLDASASMLDETIVNVIRRRNLPDSEKVQSPKWQRAIATVEWIVANLPKYAEFQLLTFNETASPAFAARGLDWLQAVDDADTNSVIDGIKDTVPAGGTSLHNAYALAGKLQPPPDNIFLIIDSLPTLGEKAGRRNVISSRDRIKLFNESLGLLPDAVVNVILFPMEGDPMAAPSFWHLAQITGGSFLAPPEDWP